MDLRYHDKYRARIREWRPLDSVIQEGLELEAKERAKAAAEAAYQKAKADAKAAKAEAAERAAKKRADDEAAGIYVQEEEEDHHHHHHEHKRRYRMSDEKRKRPATRRGNSQRGPQKGKLYPKKAPAAVARDVYGAVRTTTFAESTKNFAANAKLRGGKVRAFPRDMDPSELRHQMGAAVRTSYINGELRKARREKYDNDLNALHEAEMVVDAAKAVRVSGGWGGRQSSSGVGGGGKWW